MFAIQHALLLFWFGFFVFFKREFSKIKKIIKCNAMHSVNIYKKQYSILSEIFICKTYRLFYVATDRSLGEGRLERVEGSQTVIGIHCMRKETVYNLKYRLKK